MPKLDFNTAIMPTLDLTMMDDDHTEVRVTVPTEGLVEELQAAGAQLQGIMEKQDAAGIQAVYNLAARLMSCNREGLQMTADDLRGKYRLNLEALLLFFSAYMDFISEINNAKN